MHSDYSLKTVERTLKLLDLFVSQPTYGWGLTELSETLGMHKPNVLRILTTLERHGYLAREDGVPRYQLGPSALTLGAATKSQVRRVAYPELRRLVEETRETALLHVISGTEAVCADKVESPQPVRVAFDIGRKGPLYAGSSGKSLLAFLKPMEIEQLLPKLELHRYTEWSITNLEELRQEIARIRELGYATSCGELDEGVCSIGAPIWNSFGRLEASIAVVGPSTRWNEEQWRYYVHKTVESTRRVSCNLGSRHI